MYRVRERVLFVLGDILCIGLIKEIDGGYIDIEDEVLFTRYVILWNTKKNIFKISECPGAVWVLSGWCTGNSNLLVRLYRISETIKGVCQHLSSTKFSFILIRRKRSGWNRISFKTGFRKCPLLFLKTMHCIMFSSDLQRVSQILKMKDHGFPWFLTFSAQRF